MRHRPSETRTLAVKLATEEVAVRATQLAEKTLATVQREQLAKDIARGHKEEVDKLKAETKSLAHTVRTGKEDQPVECHWAIENKPSREGVVRRMWVLRSSLTDEEVACEAAVASDFQDELPLDLEPRRDRN